ncbi:MAG: type VI secretion system baseplate subunit TssE [Treponema sp.]|nr:type VI secretion system baseplate subunit TssE [Treponema sp.]
MPTPNRFYGSQREQDLEDTSKEPARYRPYLLSRLTDLDPLEKKDVFDRIINSKQLKKDVFDNIEMLFYSRSHLSPAEMGNIAELENSVLGYGIVDFCGRMHSKSNEEFLREHIRKQLVDFEPRLDPATVAVDFFSSENSIESLLEFHISGMIRAGEVNEEVRFISKINLETGLADLSFEGLV